MEMSFSPACRELLRAPDTSVRVERPGLPAIMLGGLERIAEMTPEAHGVPSSFRLKFAIQAVRTGDGWNPQRIGWRAPTRHEERLEITIRAGEPITVETTQLCAVWKVRADEGDCTFFIGCYAIDFSSIAPAPEPRMPFSWSGPRPNQL